MEITDIKFLQTTTCLKCGASINGKHFKAPFIQIKLPHGFYGGLVKKLIKAVCDCGEEYVVAVQTKGQKQIVKNLAYFYGRPAEVSEQTLVTKESLEALSRMELLEFAKNADIKGIATKKSTDIIGIILSEINQ